MKYGSIILLLTISLLYDSMLYCQRDSVAARHDITTFIKGHCNEKYIAWELFTSGFEWETSDTTFLLSQAMLCWDNADGITCIALKGSSVSFDSLKTKEWFRLPDPAALITLDNIRLQKEGVMYKAAPLAFNLAPATHILSIYDSLAKTEAFIASYKNEFLLSRSIFEKGFTIRLTDSSYTLLSFFVSFGYHDKDEPLSFYFEGNTPNTSIAGYRQAVAQLIYKDGITIENIYAAKNGKVYRVPDLVFALKQ